MKALEPVEAGLDRLVAAHPAIEKITITYPVESGEGTEKSVRKGLAKLDVRRTGSGPDPGPEVREEIVRLFWLSRLYPLTEIQLWTGESTTVELTGAHARRLEHRYGPRPYGPLDRPAPGPRDTAR
jgi:hypothetical protein